MGLDISEALETSYMSQLPTQTNEARRIQELYKYQILDSGPEHAFDEIAKVASLCCGTEMAAITFIDKDRQWLKSKVGIAASETPRDVSFCTHAIEHPQIMVVPDARADSRFANNPMVTSEPRICFYAGAPLETEAGARIGTLCVMDTHIKNLNKYQIEILEILSRHVIHLLDFRYQVNSLSNMAREMNQIRNKAVDLARLKSEFLSNISHELRTPLAGVMGLVEVLKYTDLNPEQGQYIDAISTSANNLLEVVNKILDISRIEAGLTSIDTSKFELNSLLQDLERRFHYSARSKNLDFRILSVDQPYSFWGDKRRITQILNNLLANAIKFTDHGKVFLETKVQKLQGPRYHVRFEVHDTGPGINKKTFEGMFHTFSQADASLTRNFGGLGLGLSISKQLAELMGGEIGVDSQVGLGSVFWVELNLKGEP